MNEEKKKLIVNKIINEILSNNKEELFNKNFFFSLNYRLRQIINNDERKECFYRIVIEILNHYKDNIDFLFMGRIGIEYVFYYFEGIDNYIPEDKLTEFDNYLRETVVHSKCFLDLLLINRIQHTILYTDLLSQTKFYELIDYFTSLLNKLKILSLIKNLSPSFLEETIKNSQYANNYQFKETIDCIIINIMILNFDKSKDYIHLLQLEDSIMELKDSPYKLLSTLTEEQKEIFFSYGILQELL